MKINETITTIKENETLKQLQLDNRCEDLPEEVFLLNSKSSSGLILLVTIFIICFICFVSFCKIDRVIRANGIVRPKDNLSMIKNIVEGKVLSINKFNGQFVNAKDEIYSIDCTDIGLEKENLENNYKKYLVDLEDNKKILNIINHKDTISKTETEILLAEYNVYVSKINKMEKQNEILKIQYSIELNTPITLTTENNILQKKNEYELSVLELNEYKNEYKAKIINTINQLQTDIKNILNNIENMEFQLAHSKVIAPVSGYLIIDKDINVGDYISGNQEIGKIVPVDERECKAEIMVKAKDIGQLTTGLKVKCRFPSFPYNEYKGLTANIKSINADSSIDDNGIYYKIICVFDKTFLQDKHNKKHYLKPGIEVDARIVIEKKTILSFFLEKMDFTI